MINSKTVFVIGAGAGHDIGMPLGDRLSGIIGEKLNMKHSTQQISGGQLNLEALRNIARAEQIDLNLYRKAGVGVAGGIV
jgi:hypothetical protein